MVVITRENVDGVCAEVLEIIENATFAAIDFEFVGLAKDDSDLRPSLFDSPASRYLKNRAAIRKFPPCQFGFAIFTERDNGRSFDVRRYSAHLLRRSGNRGRVFSASSSSLTFLSRNGFDFNAFVKNGVDYMNESDIRELEKVLESGVFIYDSVRESLHERLQLAKCLVAKNLALQAALTHSNLDGNDSERLCPGCLYSGNVVHTVDGDCRVEIPLFVASSNEVCAKEDACGAVFEWSPDAVERAALVYELHRVFPRLSFSINCDRTMLICERNDESEEQTRDRLVLLRDRFLNAARGISVIAKAMASKLPIIGHNAMLDFLYFVEYFMDDLPESYDGWKAIVLSTFRFVADTRHIATFFKKRLSKEGIIDYSLKTLITFFTSESRGIDVDFLFPRFDLHEVDDSKESDSTFHDAIFDALIAGEVFVYFSYLLAHSRKLSVNECGSYPFSRLSFCVHRECGAVNRINASFLGSPFCNIEGADPPSERPSFIVVELREPARSLFDVFIDLFAGAISDSEMRDLVSELKFEFGEWRFDVRRARRRRQLEIACNSFSTYSKLYTYMCVHSKFRIVRSGCDDNVKVGRYVLVGEEVNENGNANRTTRRLIAFLDTFVICSFLLGCWAFRRGF